MLLLFVYANQDACYAVNALMPTSFRFLSPLEPEPVHPLTIAIKQPYATLHLHIISTLESVKKHHARLQGYYKVELSQ